MRHPHYSSFPAPFKRKEKGKGTWKGGKRVKRSRTVSSSPTRRKKSKQKKGKKKKRGKDGPRRHALNKSISIPPQPRKLLLKVTHPDDGGGTKEKGGGGGKEKPHDFGPSPFPTA